MLLIISNIVFDQNSGDYDKY